MSGLSLNVNNYVKFILVIITGVLIGILSLHPIAILSFVASIIAIIVVTCIVLKPYRFVYLFMVYILFQNFIGIILAKYSGTLSQAVIASKDLITYLALGIVVIANYKKFRLTLPDLFAFLYLFILSVYLVLQSDVSPFVKLVQFRQLVTPVILYLLGRFMFIELERTKVFLKFLVYISVIAVLFGIVERYFLKVTFWADLGMTKFLVLKGMEKWIIGEGVLGNFYTYDFYAFVGMPIRRMVSFIADPTLFGQFLVFPISILMFTKVVVRFRKTFLLILLFGLISTLSKGGFFALGIVIIYKVFRSKYKPFGWFMSFLMVIVIIFILNNSSMFSSLPFHIRGLVHNFTLMFSNPFGLGLGRSGNFAVLLTSSNDEIGSGESYIGMIEGQVGIFSILFVLFLFTIIQLLKKESIKQKEMKNIIVAFSATLIGTISASMLSESAISFTSAGIFLLMLGSLVSNCIKTEDKNGYG